jgi:Undecaprenyl-phosphate glucose phosphotransferase
MKKRIKSKLSTISSRVIIGIIRFTDLLLLFTSGVIANNFIPISDRLYSEGPLIIATTVASAVAALSLKNASAYRHDALLSLVLQAQLSIKPLLSGTCGAIIYLFLFYNDFGHVRMWPFAWMSLAVALIAGARYLEVWLIGHLTKNGRLARKVAVVGVSAFSQQFIERLREEPDAYRIIGLYDDRQTRVPLSQVGVDVLGTVQDLLSRLQQESVDVIVIALPLSATDRISALLQKLEPSVADICLTTDLVGLRFSSRQIGDVGRNPVVSIREAPFKDWRAVQKATTDYILGAVALILLLPILLATAVLIKIDSKGPIIFRQPRLGFNNKLFVCYKFRSMQSDKADLLADKQTTRDDPRITRVGRIIRKLSIDELPQIFNVLNGTMSLVGPRPHAPNTKAADRLFADVVQQYALRHRVKPGITGWAQANGWRGETKTSMQIERRVAYDLFYIENWSMKFDFRIIGLTIWNEIRSKHAF